MELRQLKNYIEIIEQQSITGAAKKLFLSQPVLSNQLKELEKELNTTLLVRTSRHQELTPAGKALYEKAKQILALEENAKYEVQDISSGHNGTLRLGILPSLSLSLLGNTLSEFCQTYPAISYYIKEAPTTELLHLLENGVIDVALVRTPCAISPEMKSISISSDRLVIAYHKDYYRLPADVPFRLCQLQTKPLLVSERFAPLFEHACLQEGFQPEYRCQVTDMSTVLAWAEHGLGIAVIPYSTLLVNSNSKIEYRELENNIFDISIMMVYVQGRYLPEQTLTFIKYCQERSSIDTKITDNKEML